jgi:hypothetical protein
MGISKLCLEFALNYHASSVICVAGVEYRFVVFCSAVASGLVLEVFNNNNNNHLSSFR